MSRRGRRPTPPQDRAVKLTVTIPNRLREELHDAAVADTRSISNFLTLLINRALGARRSTQPDAPATPDGGPMSRDRQPPDPC